MKSILNCFNGFLVGVYGMWTLKNIYFAQSQPEVLEYAKSQNLTVHHLTTPVAIQKWNTLTNDPDNASKIGLLLHSTC